VVAVDPAIDALQREIEEKAVLTIARRQPMAVDLREIVSAARRQRPRAHYDLAKNIGKRVAALIGEFHPPKLMRGVEHMAAMVLAQLKEVLDSYAGHDLDKALAVWNGDERSTPCAPRCSGSPDLHDGGPRNITF
jgi:phosphate transport system protein